MASILEWQLIIKNYMFLFQIDGSNRDYDNEAKPGLYALDFLKGEIFGPSYQKIYVLNLENLYMEKVIVSWAFSCYFND